MCVCVCVCVCVYAYTHVVFARTNIISRASVQLGTVQPTMADVNVYVQES